MLSCPLVSLGFCWQHGTCAEQLTPLATELDFFSQTLALAQKYNVVNMLAAAGITPSSNTVQTSDFTAAISSSFGGQPFLDCSSYQLTAVGLCLDKNLSPQDCPSNLESTCGSSFTFPAAQF